MGVRVFSQRQKPGRPASESLVRFVLRSGRERMQVKCWWNTKKYIDCSAARLTAADGCTYVLVWPHSYDSRLDVAWSVANGTLEFERFERVTRVALACPDGTVLRHWKFPTVPGQKPTQIDLNDSCPDGCSPGGGKPPGGDELLFCWTIPKLPTIESSEPVAPKSTELFGVCTDINNLPSL